MDTRSGHIISPEEFRALPKEQQQHYKPMQSAPTAEQMKRGKIGRNDSCPCQSGKRFKNCCQFKATADKLETLQQQRDQLLVGGKRYTLKDKKHIIKTLGMFATLGAGMVK